MIIKLSIIILLNVNTPPEWKTFEDHSARGVAQDEIVPSTRNTKRCCTITCLLNYLHTLNVVLWKKGKESLWHVCVSMKIISFLFFSPRPHAPAVWYDTDAECTVGPARHRRTSAATMFLKMFFGKRRKNSIQDSILYSLL